MKPATSSFRRRQRARAQALVKDREEVRAFQKAALKVWARDEAHRARVPGMVKGQFTISPDFDKPLPPDEWDME